MQRRDLDDIRNEIREGFKQTHDLQRLTNGRLLKAENNITELEKANIQRFVERKYEKFIWWVCTTAVGVVIALASFILYN